MTEHAAATDDATDETTDAAHQATERTAKEGRRSAAAARRRAREAQIVKATRQLFDERGVRDAQIEDIARAVGINRAIVYRHFTGKEEIFALTLVDYLDELREALVAADPGEGAAHERLAATVSAFVDYGVAHPAFVDCAQALMRQTGPELVDELSERALFRLGRAITGTLAVPQRIFADGTAQGEFNVTNPTLLANMFYSTGLGALQLARVGLLVSESAPGVPTMTGVSLDQVRDYLIAAAVALAKG